MEPGVGGGIERAGAVQRAGGHGKLDLLIAAEAEVSDTNFWLARGHGDGTFAAAVAPFAPHEVPPPAFLAVGDRDGDGFPDLFHRDSDFASDAVQGQIGADFDGDGRDDLMSYDFAAGRVLVYLTRTP